MPLSVPVPSSRANRARFHSFWSGARRGLGVALALAACAGPATRAHSAAGSHASSPLAPDGRVVVLGFDGADGRTLVQLMDQGELPNFAALRSSGTFAPLRSTAPPESPVAWAALNTGRNPAKTGVASFFVRKLDEFGAPRPDFGHLVDQQGPNARPIGEFEHAPLPRRALELSRGVFAGATAALVFAGFAVLFLLLLRMRRAMGLALSALMALTAGFGAWSLRQYVPATLPRWGNPLQTESFWNSAAHAGKRSVVLEAAQAFDEPTVEGAEVLYGLGVPDAKGGLGDWCVYTSSEEELARAPEGRPTGTAGKVFRVDERGGEIRSQIYGPVNFWKLERLQQQKTELELSEVNVGYKRSLEINAQKEELERQRKALLSGVSLELQATRVTDGWRVRLGDQEHELKAGQWSDFYHLRFELNPMLAVRAVTRCKLVSAEAPFELFVDVLHIDPAAQPFWQPITNPFGYAGRLARACGSFETYGWACMTMPLKDEEIDPTTFLEDIEFTLGWRERMTYAEFERGGWDMLMSVLSETDRVQHMLYQYYDREHPLYDAAKAAREVTFFGKRLPLSQAIPEIYRQADRVVGEIRRRLAPSDTLLICSDHGFQSFRTQVHVNNWLLQKGYLALKPGAKLTDAGTTQVGGYVDWSKTRAYAMSLGFIYVNEKGREGQGIVEPGDKEALLDALERDWLADRDASGQPICSAVYRPAKLHVGKFLEREADLILGFAPPYHVSWRTGLGGLALDDAGSAPGPIFEPNRSSWSGDHTSMDLETVKGIFLSNRRFELPAGGPDLLHIAPTTLALLGVPVPTDYDVAALPLARE
jgi:predicted AlkP superfamily phosphohydrolase/phosphomutase